jgi:hypothetical protein
MSFLNYDFRFLKSKIGLRQGPQVDGGGVWENWRNWSGGLRFGCGVVDLVRFFQDEVVNPVAAFSFGFQALDQPEKTVLPLEGQCIQFLEVGGIDLGRRLAGNVARNADSRITRPSAACSCTRKTWLNQIVPRFGCR